jgi:hypothetical protein
MILGVILVSSGMTPYLLVRMCRIEMKLVKNTLHDVIDFSITT